MIMESGGKYLWARWIWLRCLGLIFLSAFYSLAFQVHGLIGEDGILPASGYLSQVARFFGPVKSIWYAPTLLWIDAGSTAITVLLVGGFIASILLIFNIAPRVATAACTILFLSFIAALQDFSSYQSDGMLLEAGFLSLFFAPGGLRPGLGTSDPPSAFSLFMLRWEWFRIYFESGVVKLASGDPHWRNLTAMDDYYQNGPLPSWLGWYVQQLPHWYHAGTVLLTLFVELILVWAVFLPRRLRLACFVIVSALQIGIISTANYAFLNYLVLALGILLVDDDLFARFRFAGIIENAREIPVRSAFRRRFENVVLGFALYVTIAAFLFGGTGLGAPANLIAPFRIANAYGLFAVMTPARYEIEFQGSNDGVKWTPYQYRYKPQNIYERPGFYAPYQPRFDWNLWFASLGPASESPWVMNAQHRLLQGSPDVLALFRSDPFKGKPPRMVRTILYQYWFTTVAEKRKTGAWWRRQALQPFMPVAVR
ncbi:MAG TPA: lipase maturation factor family protein [Gemmatimonadaceae bacterium]